MSEPVYNKELFAKVKTRERELTIQHWETEKKRNHQINKLLQLSNNRSHFQTKEKVRATATQKLIEKEMKELIFSKDSRMQDLIEDECESDTEPEDEKVVALMRIQREREKKAFLKNLPFKVK
jgi:hypothetical protein